DYYGFEPLLPQECYWGTPTDNLVLAGQLPLPIAAAMGRGSGGGVPPPRWKLRIGAQYAEDGPGGRGAGASEATGRHLCTWEHCPCGCAAPSFPPQPATNA